jgi:N-methylhydantoinase A
MLLHCYVNPAHEARVKAIVRKRLPGVFVTASHELSQEYREFERCSTAAANAYIGPVVSEYLGGIEAQLKRSGFVGSFLLVQSTGGLYESHQARRNGAHARVGPGRRRDRCAGAVPRARPRGRGGLRHGGTTAKAGVIHRGEALTTGAALIGATTSVHWRRSHDGHLEVGTGAARDSGRDRGRSWVGPAGAEPGAG